MVVGCGDVPQLECSLRPSAAVDRLPFLKQYNAEQRLGCIVFFEGTALEHFEAPISALCRVGFKLFCQRGL